MATAPAQTWPFLVVLMSSSAPGEPPHVRGLGFKQGDLIVTLDHIARATDVIQHADWPDARPVRLLTTSEGGLALMAVTDPPRDTSGRTPLGEATGPVEIAALSDVFTHHSRYRRARRRGGPIRPLYGGAPRLSE